MSEDAGVSKEMCMCDLASASLRDIGFARLSLLSYYYLPDTLKCEWTLGL